MRKLTTDEFIKKATAKHGLKYDYSKAEYIGGHKKLEVICSDHGSFFIAHLTITQERAVLNVQQL